MTNITEFYPGADKNAPDGKNLLAAHDAYNENRRNDSYPAGACGNPKQGGDVQIGTQQNPGNLNFDNPALKMFGADDIKEDTRSYVLAVLPDEEEQTS